jgi:hypothetical protein
MTSSTGTICIFVHHGWPAFSTRADFVTYTCIMDHQPPTHLTDDHAVPMGFVVLPAFVGTLLWLITMLSRYSQL